MLVLEVAKEKELVFAIKEVRDLNRPAQGHTEEVSVQ